MADVVVVGGGVIGLSLAYELAGRGIAVQVLDQGTPGQEASWAGAGMLPPGNPRDARRPEAQLRAESHLLSPALSQALFEQTGIDNGYRRTGALELSLEEDSPEYVAEMDAWRREGVVVEELPSAASRESALSPEIRRAYLLPEMAQVRNPRHLKALIAGCAVRGVKFSPGTPVAALIRNGDRIEGVRTLNGTIFADQYVIASGAWSQSVLAELGRGIAIRPVRGQMVLLSVQPLPFIHILSLGQRYLVPRPDGRILVGSTEEEAGFDKRNTAAGIGGLIEFATRLVPCLAAARFERAWAGLRPGSPDGLPYLCQVPETRNLFLAAGHFRAGLQLSPISALLMSQLLRGETPRIPMQAYGIEGRMSSCGQ